MTRMVYWLLIATAIAWAWRRAWRHIGAACMLAPWFFSADMADVFVMSFAFGAFDQEMGRAFKLVRRRISA